MAGIQTRGLGYAAQLIGRVSGVHSLDVEADRLLAHGYRIFIERHLRHRAVICS